MSPLGAVVLLLCGLAAWLVLGARFFLREVTATPKPSQPTEVYNGDWED